MRRGCPFDPPAELGELRETAPITRVTLWDGSMPWLITRHEHVRAVLADRRFSADTTRPGFPVVSASTLARRRTAPAFISMDDPDHARFRRMLIGEFTVRRIGTLRPRIERLVGELLDEMAAGPKPVDLVTAFALPVPSLVICELLGVPYADHDYFQEHSKALLDTRTDAAEAVRRTEELRDYLADLVAEREHTPAEDLLGHLATRYVLRGELTRDEAASMALLLLVAGHETTANMIGLGTLTLLHHPEQAAQLRDGEPTLVNAAVEELLRLLSVTHTGRRRQATEDVELAGVTIRAGEGVIAAGDAANRDPTEFAHPDELDLHRESNHHVAFGFGVHQCLGQPLARLELQVAYPALLRRFPTLRVAAPLEQLAFRDEMVVYGVHALPVTW
ncbi:MAG TPA: cytochrome P450 [Pseudonocardia sp.]|nr:cytochrome P450 [Pseudonocardia sp.]